MLHVAPQYCVVVCETRSKPQPPYSSPWRERDSRVGGRIDRAGLVVVGRVSHILDEKKRLYIFQTKILKTTLDVMKDESEI